MAAEQNSGLQSVPVAEVKIADGFWKDKIEVVRDKTIAHNFMECDTHGRFRNFDRAAGVLGGAWEGKYFFDDSDPYKTIEGAAYVLMQKRDPELEKQIDDIAKRVAAAQMKDGYVDTWYQVKIGIDKRFTQEKDFHETYVAGHLIEAAVAYFEATGKRNLLDIAIKFADCIDHNFGPGKRLDPPGHEEIELALVKLYHVTNEPRYLKLAEWFVAQRGETEGRATNRDYDQDQLPVKEQREIVGHAVRAMYLYCGVADLARITGDKDYFTTMDSIWHDVVDRKMYVTGGIGPSGRNEGFTVAYDLPNDSAYAETCAGIGLGLWNQRLTLMHADGKYADVVERGMYNGILSGISLDGTKFFYVNPLSSRGDHHREAWFDCPCCPPNVERFIASIGERVYAFDANQILVNQFISSDTTVKLAKTAVKLSQRTNYPWDGDVKITVNAEPAEQFLIKVRIPGWCEGASIAVNGQKMEKLDVSNGYASVDRKWGAGDVVEVNFPMPVKRVYADPHVDADVGRVTIGRGPIIYALEGVDNERAVRNLVLPKDAEMTSEFRKDLLGGVTVVKGTATAVMDEDPAHDVKKDFVAVPYYAWDNRSPGQMIVWLAEDRKVAEIPRDANVKISASYVHATLEALDDRLVPKSSVDFNVANFDFWPRKGTTEWVQYDFKEPRTVSSSEVYWFDDTGHGECRVPVSWRLLYKDGEAWKPVEKASEYGVGLNQFNKVTFEAVTTKTVRMEVKLPEKFSAGIFEWRVGK
ncbi:MAG TPA: beta-L-arabinofuranosidase domain-containing protein [Tepidisphaeraceae bacterium]|nr:beta-L-arabinofuranosidase domain-containing protein [Tepidisphaeraceae bacterium]